LRVVCRRMQSISTTAIPTPFVPAHSALACQTIPQAAPRRLLCTPGQRLQRHQQTLKVQQQRRARGQHPRQKPRQRIRSKKLPRALHRAVLQAAFKRVKLLGPSIARTSHTLPCPSQATRTRNVNVNVYSTLSPVKTSLNPKNVRVYVNIWQLWDPLEQCGPCKMQRMLCVLLCVCYEAFVCLCLEVTIANSRRSVCVYTRRLTVRIAGGLQCES